MSLLPIKFHQIPIFPPWFRGYHGLSYLYIMGLFNAENLQIRWFAPVKVVSSPPPLPLHWASLWGTLEVSSRDKHPWEWMDIIGYPKIGWENIQRLPSRMGWPTKLLSSKLRWRMENRSKDISSIAANGSNIGQFGIYMNLSHPCSWNGDI